MAATIRRGTPSNPAGRDQELAATDAVVEAALAGATASLAVVAEPGAGLTPFLVQVAARHAGTLTVRFAGADDLRGVATVALRLLGLSELPPSGRRPRQRSFFEAGVSGVGAAVTVEVLAARAEAAVRDRPQLWVIDDAHLLDDLSVRFVDSVHTSGTLPIAIVWGTHDPDRPRIRHQRLLPLEHLGPDGDRTGGWARPPTAPALLDALVGDGLVVSAAAVSGGRFLAIDVADLLGSPMDRCLAELAALEGAGVLVADGEAYRFTHPHDRRAALDRISPPQRAALHARAARLLMERGGDPLVVAEHLVGAGAPLPGALDWLVGAAEDLMGTDPLGASVLLDLALDQTRNPPRRLSRARARALSTVGRVEEAEALVQVLLLDAAGDERALLERDLAMTRFHQGRAGEAVDILASAVAAAEDHRLGARLDAERALAHLMAADFTSARRAAIRASEQGQAIGDPVTVLAAEMVECLVALYVHDVADAVSLAGRLESMGDLPETADAGLYQPWFAASLTRLELGDFDHSRRLNAQGRRRALDDGHLWMAPAYDALDAYLSWEQGAFDDAVASAHGSLGWPLEDSFGTAIWCHSFLGRIAAARGDWDGARQAAEEARARVLTDRAQFGWEHLALLDADLAVYDGEPGRALDLLQANWEVFRDLGVASARPDLIVAMVPLLPAPDDPRGPELLADLRVAADRTGCPKVAADLAYAEASLARDPDRLAASAGRYEALGRFHRAARVLAEAATVAEADDPSRARSLARQARVLLEERGADGDLAAIRHLCVGRPRSRAAGALTPSEGTVVDLVATGLTNGEIADRLSLSRRTVESHVSSAYRKFGVSNRVELARTAAERAG